MVGDVRGEGRKEVLECREFAQHKLWKLKHNLQNDYWYVL